MDQAIARKPSLPLGPHTSPSSAQKSPASSATWALAQGMEGCCKPVPPSPAGPAAACSGHTRQRQIHKDSFGLFATRQEVGFWVWQVPPLSPPMSPHCRGQPAEVYFSGVYFSGVQARIRVPL